MFNMCPVCTRKNIRADRFRGSSASASSTVTRSVGCFRISGFQSHLHACVPTKPVLRVSPPHLSYYPVQTEDTSNRTSASTSPTVTRSARCCSASSVLVQGPVLAPHRCKGFLEQSSYRSICASGRETLAVHTSLSYMGGPHVPGLPGPSGPTSSECKWETHSMTPGRSHETQAGSQGTDSD